jgi:CubicO group peptidase (beta-lactamase class C family)
MNMLAQNAYRQLVSRRAAIGLSLLALVVAARSIRAAELSAEKRTAIDAAVEKFKAAKGIPGLSVAIGVDHELSYEKGYGLADVENNVPATPDTIYRLASISKMLTGTAVMQLVEQGKIDLAAPIQKYVPKFPEKQAPITCELLLKHQSGIRHYRGADEVRSNIPYARVSDSFKIFQDDPLLFAPGEKFSYTTYGYCVLGAAIEGASGEGYVTYVQKHVCEPAGMKTIQPDVQQKIIPNRANGYRKTGPLVVNDFAVDVSNKIPGGGWCATPADLVRFAIALDQGKLVSRETLDRMWTVQKTAEGKETPCGLGCFIITIDGDRRVYHSGGQPKVSTFLTFSPERKTAVAVMCNLRNTPVQFLADELMKVAQQPTASP